MTRQWPENEWIWISVCSRHRDREHGCAACTMGKWEWSEDLERDSVLFDTDYEAWYALHNDGEKPDESAWQTWEQITKKKRPKQ